MPKPELYPENLPARFRKGTVARIDKAIGSPRGRAEYIRRAVAEKLERDGIGEEVEEDHVAGQ